MSINNVLGSEIPIFLILRNYISIFLFGHIMTPKVIIALILDLYFMVNCVTGLHFFSKNLVEPVCSPIQ